MEEWMKTKAALGQITPCLRPTSVKFHNPWSCREKQPSGLEGMHMLLGWSQIPTPGEHASHSPIHGRTCQSPTPAAQWLVGKLTKFPSKEFAMTTIPNEYWSHVRLGGQGLSTKYGISNSILTDVISRVLEVTAWSFPLLQAAEKYVLIWLDLREDLTVSSISIGDQPGYFCKSSVLNFLEWVGDGQSAALIGY